MRPDAEQVGARSTALLVPGATVLANAVSYLLVLVAARRLPHPAYGELVVLLGVLLIASVPALALQTVAARRTAVASDPPAVLFGTAVVAAIATAAALLAAPLLVAFLHLGAGYGLLAVAATIAPLAVLGTIQGLAQGGRAFGRLAGLILATVGARAVGGLVGLISAGSPTGCLVGVACATWVAALIALFRLRPGRPDRSPRPALRDVLVEVMHAAHGYAAFLLVTSLDVLLARHVLSTHDAGTYAAGSVVTRVALWLPQSVAVLMFATFTDHGRHGRAYARSVAGVAAIGGLTVVGVAVLGRLTVSLVAGSNYHTLDSSIWIYASIGGSLAVLQLSIVAGLALRRPGRIAIIWVVATSDVVAALFTNPGSATDLARILAVVSLAGAVASVALALAPRKRLVDGSAVAVRLAVVSGQESNP